MPEQYRTKTGRVLTDADIERWADEAERGYDIEPLLANKRASERRQVKSWITRFWAWLGFGPHPYIVLYRVERSTPSETVTSWDAYEAAPQQARNANEAIISFQADSGLSGTFRAVPAVEWEHMRTLISRDD